MCSGILLRQMIQRFVLAVNYDFFFDDGLLVVNRRGGSKFALSEDEGRFTWQSRFGSVTLNQFGRELPTCGMNERGLAVHLLQSDGDPYPPNPDRRPELMELQWIQYILDTAGSLQEALASLDEICIQESFFRLQFALSDAHEAAFVAPMDGQLVVTRFNDRASAVTNTPFERALAVYEGRPADGLADSLRRFRALYTYAEKSGPVSDPVAASFDGLGLVQVRTSFWKRMWARLVGRPQGFTAWQTVFLPQEGMIHLRTARDPRTKFIRLNDLDFSEDAPTMIWDLLSSGDGDLKSHLQPYTRAKHAELIERVYSRLQPDMPSSEKTQLADYPEMFTYAKI